MGSRTETWLSAAVRRRRLGRDRWVGAAVCMQRRRQARGPLRIAARKIAVRVMFTFAGYGDVMTALANTGTSNVWSLRRRSDTYVGYFRYSQSPRPNVNPALTFRLRCLRSEARATYREHAGTERIDLRA